MFRLLFLFVATLFASTCFASEAKAPPLIQDAPPQITVIVPEPWLDLQAIRHLTCGDFVGTGEIIKPNLVLTAAHVVQDRNTCIDTATGALGNIVIRDNTLDLALLQFPSDVLPQRIVHISCQGFKNGEVYYSLGWMLGKEFVIEKMIGTGIIIHSITTFSGGNFTNLYMLNGTLIPGMSGGPILDSEGEMVGTNQTTDWNGVDNMGHYAGSRQLSDSFLCPSTAKIHNSIKPTDQEK